VKCLIDECLSPELVVIARARGHGESTHVTWLGMRSRNDWSIVRRAIADGYVLVTNNTTDFKALLRREEVHAGLVCINVAPGLMSLDVQKRLFALALDRLGDREPVNELLQITLDEHKVIHVEHYDFPADS
jgi:predicted nuclease of predicted toxin-antitoxin system